jgi:hypothetical protein
LNFAVGYNEGNIFNGEKIAWYYKGVSEQMNDYIKELVEEGKLKNKKFNISLWLFPPLGTRLCLFFFSSFGRWFIQ